MYKEFGDIAMNGIGTILEILANRLTLILGSKKFIF